jgi:hypothetical protein
VWLTERGYRVVAVKVSAVDANVQAVLDDLSKVLPTA